MAKNVNVHQWSPLTINVASSPTSVKTVNLPGGAKPWDIVCRSSKCYVLGAIAKSAGQYIITVNQSSDLVNWSELFHFQSDTFARSFEIDDVSNFYFVLGCQTSPLPVSTGSILRVSKSSWLL